MYFTKCINYFLNPIKMLQFNSPETARRTAIYVRISTNKQQTDRQVVELKEYASKAGITITDDDIFTDIISGFKDENSDRSILFSSKKSRLENTSKYCSANSAGWTASHQTCSGP